VAFAPAYGAASNTLRVSTGDALAVTGLLIPHTIPAARIEIPMGPAARPAEGPGGGRANAIVSAQGEAQRAAPTRFALYDAGPNPFSTGATLALEIPRAGRVRVAVYDATGRLVRVLIDRFMGVGRYTVEWDGMSSDGTRPGAGLFFVRVTAHGFAFSHKVIALQ
jgi:methionine-rich copper-binding protein CopC